MSDEVQNQGSESRAMSSGLKMALLVLAGIYILVSGYLMITSYSRIGKLEEQQKAQEQDTQKKIATLRSETQASTGALADKLGMTQKELATRSSQLQAQQRAAESRLSEQQKEQIGAVSTDVAAVKTDVGGVKTDVATTKQQLADTQAKLQSVIGDLNVQSGLIAKTRGDLDELKRRGDRNYFEFSLLKGQKPTAISTIALQLKKVDVKKGKFTLAVIADDRSFEKKDRLMYEPMQFYTGKDRQLYELVVFEVDKNKVGGYLSTPKAAPTTAAQ
jgi:hypothetical protein